MARESGDKSIDAGRQGTPGVYAFFARYIMKPGDSCLDVGGGLGRGLVIMRERSDNVRAIDLDPRLEGFGVERGDVKNEPSDGYDWGVSVDVVEHVQDDNKFVANLWRVSRKGIFVSTPNQEHHPDRIGEYHVREYTTSEFRALVSENCPGASVHHFGSGVYGGSLTYRNLSPMWEHQIVLALKQPDPVLSATFAFRDLLFVFRKGL